MPLPPPVITSFILTCGPDLTGVSWARLASVVGVAVSAWALSPSNVALQGVTAGAVGAGTVFGKVFITPAPIIVPTSALAVLFGNMAPSVARAVGLGVAAAFNSSALYQGASAGVGTGTDLSKVSLSNGPALVLALNAAAGSMTLAGVDVPRVMVALGTGVANLVLTGTGVGTVAGPVGPSPGAGTSTSWVL